MSQKPNLNQADIELLNQLLDKRFEEQNKRIELRFRQQDKRFDKQDKKIEERLQNHYEGFMGIVRQTVREESVSREELREELKHLPTKEEYYAGQDKIMGELKTVREEQSAHMAIHDRIEKRLQQVEKKTGLSSVVN